MKTRWCHCAISVFVLTIFTFSVFSEDTFSFSGSVREYNGCSQETAIPVENARVTISDNMSCMIDGQAKRKVFTNSVYSTTTDNDGQYSFTNLEVDNFTCGKIVQSVTVEAEGYFPQSRDIVPGETTKLDFDLFKEFGNDSIFEIALSVFLIDTTWACMEGGSCIQNIDTIPLNDCSIEYPNRYLPWLNPQILDTTNSNGEVNLSLNKVPFVDYHIVVQSLLYPEYSADTTIEILSCNNDMKIYIPVETTSIKPNKLSDISRSNPLFSCFRTSCGFRISAKLPANLIGEKKAYAGLALFDLSGKMVGQFNSSSFISKNSNKSTFFFDITSVSHGMHVLKLGTGKRLFSRKILLR
jgi:hypothetical protein